MRVQTTDDSLVVYEDHDLNSKTVARLPKDTVIDFGDSQESDGHEWLEVVLENGGRGYVLGPTARGHTTLAATLPQSTSAPRLSGGTDPEEPKKDPRGWLFRDEDSARNAKDRWQCLLPKQKSSYQPSGKIMPIALLRLVTLGTVGGSIFTLIFAFIGTVIFGYAIAFSVHLGQFANLVNPIVGFFAICAMFTGPGIAAAAGVATVSPGVKNRSVIAEGLVAAVSSVLGWFVFCKWPLPSIARSLVDALPPEPAGGATGEMYLHYSMLKVAFLGMLPAAFIVFSVFAFLSAAKRVKQDKFCEACGESMSRHRAGCLSLKRTLDFIAAANEGHLANFSLGQESGFAPAELTVFKCDTCSAGYVEISVDFRVAYLDDRSRRRGISAKKWLGLSVPTTCNLSSFYRDEHHRVGSASRKAAVE